MMNRPMGHIITKSTASSIEPIKSVFV